ncbi:hypothetical protein [Streptomyces sp. NPDC057557]|uniref:hypothetical protein n=1 Tax=Streptomyces sp. NPDC057557 TaxID=3346167 RepID=UPI0036A2AA61
MHRIAPIGGRAVTINDEMTGIVYDDCGLIELLRRAAIYDAEQCAGRPGLDRGQERVSRGESREFLVAVRAVYRPRKARK